MDETTARLKALKLALDSLSDSEKDLRFSPNVSKLEVRANMFYTYIATGRFN